MPTQRSPRPATTKAAVRIGEALRAARHRAGLTQADLGEFIGVRRTAVAALERGELTHQTARFLEVLDVLGPELELRPRSARLASEPGPP